MFWLTNILSVSTGGLGSVVSGLQPKIELHVYQQLDYSWLSCIEVKVEAGLTDNFWDKFTVYPVLASS